MSTPRTSRLVGFVGVSIALAGCVSVTSAVPTGPDAWMIGLGAHGGLQSDAELMSRTITEAGQFCSRMGRHVEVTGTSFTGMQGWTPQSNQVMFRCLAT